MRAVKANRFIVFSQAFTQAKSAIPAESQF
jgi:hypothetical protein